jgi:lambda family phage portal protein
MTKSKSTLEANGSVVEQFSKLRNDYDAARPSIYRRTRPGILPMGTGADWHTRIEILYFSMMELSRDLFRNNVVVGQGIRRFVSNVIQDGFHPDPQTGSTELNGFLAEQWDEWTENADQCDIMGENTFHDMEGLLLQNTVVDGDIFVIPTENGSLQMMEGHRCRRPSRMRKNVVHGVELDENRKRLAYYFTQDNIPLAQQAIRLADMTRIPARDKFGNRQVHHIYRPDRATQTRGISSLAPVADTAGMGDDLFFAQLVKAQVASCYAILREYKEGHSAPAIPGQTGEMKSNVRPDGSTRRIEGTAPGMEYFGYEGETLKGFSPNVPNQEFFQHAMLILTFISINLDMPLAVFLLDPTKTNFSGWRGAMDQARLRFRSFQKWLIQHFHRPVYLWKCREWITKNPTGRRLAAKNGVQPLKHEWHRPNWPYIEPMKDRMAKTIGVKDGQISPRRSAAEDGLDYKVIVDESVEDNSYRICKALDAAKIINEKYSDLQMPVHWRELIAIPLPDGMKITLTGTEPEPGDEDQGGKSPQKNAAANSNEGDPNAS